MQKFTVREVLDLMDKALHGQEIQPVKDVTFTSTLTLDHGAKLVTLNAHIGDKVVWIAFGVNGRMMSPADRINFCVNRTFKQSDLTALHTGVVVFDPDNAIVQSETPTPGAGFIPGNRPYAGGQPHFGNHQMPFGNQMQFGDYPPGMQISDFPGSAQDSYPRMGLNQTQWISKGLANTILAAHLSVPARKLVSLVVPEINALTNQPFRWEMPENDIDTDPFVTVIHPANDLTDTDVLLVQRLLRAEYKNAGFMVDVTRTSNETVHIVVSIPV